MATYKIHKTKDYTVMSTSHLRDKNMSFKAKGLLSVMLSLPEEWDYSMNGLVAISKENLTAVRNTLQELEELGYLIRERKQNEKGQYDYEYHIYETPNTETPQLEKPYAGNLYTDNPHTDEPIQSITNKLNTNKSITNELNKENKKKESKGSFDRIIEAYTEDEKIIDLLQEWLKVRKAKRAAMTDRAVKMNIEKLDELAAKSKMTVNEYLSEVICRGWAAFYEIKNYGSNNQGGYNNEQRETINGKEYIKRNGKYYVPNGVGVEVDPYQKDDLSEVFK